MRPAIMLFLTFFSIFVVGCMLIAFHDINQFFAHTINFQTPEITKSGSHWFQLWSFDFWLLVALIISELAPFLPGKSAGIIQGFARALLLFFRRK